MDLRKSLDEPVSKFMSSNFVKLVFDDTVEQAAKAMQKKGALEAIIIKDNRAAGILTERDILYKVVADGLNPATVKVQDVMSTPVVTVEVTAKAGDAIGKMAKLGLRRLGVLRNGKMVGVVTLRSVLSTNVDTEVVLPELASPGDVTCPYCGSKMKDTKQLSKHIDDLHIGKGVLQGMKEG